MQITRSNSFRPKKAWDAKLIANIKGTTVKLHWTDEAYKWHINDGEEVFVVLDGEVEMSYKENSVIKKEILQSGDIFYASIGTEHIAKPINEARVLVIEKEGSI